MLPFVYEWQWDIGHIIFFGLFYGVLTVIFGTLVGTIIKTVRDLWSGHIHTPEHEDTPASAEG